MNIESKIEQPHQIIINVESGFDDFIPADFRQNPVEYFEKFGLNVKSGEIKKDESGRVHEDPTAVKELLSWKNNSGDEIFIIAKRVNQDKAEVALHGDPLYEAKIMKAAAEANLPVAELLATVKQGDDYLIVMKKIDGLTWSDKSSLALKERGYSVADIARLMIQAEGLLAGLKLKFDQAGIVRSWKLKDMILKIDWENKRVLELVPTDWERTVIDQGKFAEYKKAISQNYNE